MKDPPCQGVAPAIGQVPSLSTYGLFSDRSKFTDAAHGGVHTLMSPITTDQTSPTSEEDIHFSSGVPLGNESDVVASNHQHQTKTFEQLAAEKNIRAWNHEVFDDRWLQPLPSTEQNTAISKHNLPTEKVESTFQSHKRLNALNKELDETQKRMIAGKTIYRADPQQDDSEKGSAKAVHGGEQLTKE